MKKILLLLSLIIITSCSSSDDEINSPGVYFNPPTWILGTWKEIHTGEVYIFTNNNIIYSTGGRTISCIDEALDFQDQGAYVNISEIRNNDLYTANYQYSNSSTLTFSFEKISNTQIKSIGFLDGDFVKQ